MSRSVDRRIGGDLPNVVDPPGDRDGIPSTAGIEHAVQIHKAVVAIGDETVLQTAGCEAISHDRTVVIDARGRAISPAESSQIGHPSVVPYERVRGAARDIRFPDDLVEVVDTGCASSATAQGAQVNHGLAGDIKYTNQRSNPERCIVVEKSPFHAI